MLTYSSYGAVGDGLTDDFAAIKAAHEYANKHGLDVAADKGKTYNLGRHEEAIVIMTNTTWEGATFVIDDRDISPDTALRGKCVFFVRPDKPSYKVDGISSLKAGQGNVGVCFDTPVLLYIANSGAKKYVRFGANANSGADTQELILVDELGNVDPSTPIIWDYEAVTAATAW